MRASVAALSGLDATGGAGLDFRPDERLCINESCDRDWARQVILVEACALCRRHDQRFRLDNERHGRELADRASHDKQVVGVQYVPSGSSPGPVPLDAWAINIRSMRL